MSSSLVRLGAVIHLPAAVHLAIMSCALHHADELIKVDVPVTVRVRLLHEVITLRLRQFFSHVHHDVSQLRPADLTIPVIVKYGEGFPNVRLL